MIHTEYSAEDYRPPKINIGTVMRNPKMLKFVPNHSKTKKMCEHDAVEKLLFGYVPDRSKTLF